MDYFTQIFYVWLLLILQYGSAFFSFVRIEKCGICQITKLFSKLNMQDFERYKKIKQLVKMKEEGVSYQQLKEFALNRTSVHPSKRKPARSFEKRLRTIIGIKSDTLSSKESSSIRRETLQDEEDELMNDDSIENEVYWLLFPAW